MQGSKNAALPVLAAAIVTDGCRLWNCPRLTDVGTAKRILEHLGCHLEELGDSLEISPPQGGTLHIPAEWMAAMRSSILFLGGMTARFGEARMTSPGGCRLGKRPIDFHLNGLRAMGAEVIQEEREIRCRAAGGLKGAEIRLPAPSVGATENLMIAASLAEGRTILSNCAQEPEVEDLAGFLNCCGAEISFPEAGTAVIRGKRKLGHGEWHILPDRIAAATWLAMGAATGGTITLTNFRAEHLKAPLNLLEKAGCRIRLSGDTAVLTAPERLKGFGLIETGPYPAFPTDLQAIWMAASLRADGESFFRETVFENRFRQVPEFQKLGACAAQAGRGAVVSGVERLCGAEVEGFELRGTAALLTAAALAEGKSRVTGLEYLDRGYEWMENGLWQLGAEVARVRE